MNASWIWPQAQRVGDERVSGEFQLFARHFLDSQDYELLLDLVCAAPRATAGITLLWQEIQRAAVIPPALAADDFVQLRSIVTFTDLDEATARSFQLVRPGEGTGRAGISVLTPVGAALIGLRAGDTFRWRSERGRRRVLRVDKVRPDPKAAERQAIEFATDRRRRISELLSLN